MSILDYYKSSSIKDYNEGMRYASELGKNKLRSKDKKKIRKTARKRLNSVIIDEFVFED